MKIVDNLKKMEYPGRIIVIGKNPKGYITLIYSITGRSLSSQARKFEIEGQKILVKPADEEVLKTGNPDLLIYPCICAVNNGIIISNGIQIKSIVRESDNFSDPMTILLNGLKKWTYEPDAPIFTPRISGFAGINNAALSILKKSAGNEALKYFFEFPYLTDSGKFIATYSGLNINPVPSFYGEPIDIDIPYLSAEAGVKGIYELLAPASENDFRVSSACIIYKNMEDYDVAVKNRYN